MLSPVCTHGARKPGHKRHCSTSWDGYGFQAIWDAIASPWAIALFTLLPYRVFDGLLLVWRHGTEYVSCSFKTVQRPPPVTTTRSDRDMQGYQLSSGVKARAACILCLAVCQVVLTPAARIHQGQSQILETLWLVMHHASLHSLLCRQHSCNPKGNNRMPLAAKQGPGGPFADVLCEALAWGANLPPSMSEVVCHCYACVPACTGSTLRN